MTNSCSLIGFGLGAASCDKNYKSPNYSFIDGQCFIDEKYFGRIIFSDDKIIQVQIDNGNEHMEGQVITFKLIN